VYRHLKCAVFSEEIITAKDVGGYKQLKKEDYKELLKRVEASKVEIQAEKEELDPDELVPVSFQGEIRSPPEGLVANLLPFQVEGTSWMYHQEVHEPTIRGGILADEMGLGKTLQSIATILDNRPRLQHSSPGAKHPPSAPDLAERNAEETLWSEGLADWKHEMEMINVPKSLFAKGKKAAGGARAGTLVVCPLIALYQWRTEIEKFTENGTLTVGTYHGPNRAKESPRELLQKYDVVLTTYQVLEADFRKMTSPNKVKCPNCGGKYKVRVELSCILMPSTHYQYS
jgi:DNA repair protein RAD16